MNKVVAFLIPFIFCGDQISDILYLILNWNQFGNQDLKNAAIAFTVMNAIVCFCVSFYVLCLLKGIKGDAIKMMVMLLCCGWVPVIALVFLMVWGKFINLLDTFECLDKVVETKHDIKQLKAITTVLTYVQIFIEDIPQIVVQSINNTQTNQWEVFEFISLGLSILAILFEMFKFMFCKEEEGKQRSRVDQSSESFSRRR